MDRGPPGPNLEKGALLIGPHFAKDASREARGPMGTVRVGAPWGILTPQLVRQLALLQQAQEQQRLLQQQRRQPSQLPLQRR